MKIESHPMHHRRRSKSQTRRGIATVECALCLPIFVLITVSTIDLCSAIFLKESLTLAAYEGSRVGVERGGTDTIVTSRIQNFLDERGIVYSAGAIQISNPGFDTAGTLEHVTVTVTVPCAGNMPLTGGLFVGRTLTASITMRKEFVNL
jgi:Flp pilus assembly protein TadG